MKYAALVVVVLALLGMTTTARAASLPHYDLTSLAFQAKNVVRAKQTSERKVDEYTTERTMVVTANYKGDLASGATFTVSTDGYSMHAYEDVFTPPPKPPVIGPEMILFLSPKGHLVSSGLRIFRNGKAMRFAQWSNPGGYYPVPQGLDPWDSCDDPRAAKDVHLAELEAQIAVALRRSAEVKRALGSPDSQALARLVGDVIELGDESACYDDAVARAILDELSKRGDLAILLDAASRTRETRYRFPIEGDVHERALFSAAENTALPLTSRLAALRLLRERAHFIFEDSTYDARFVALVSDPEPRIRAAALLVRERHRSLPALQAAIRSLWRTETDDRVRVALVRASTRDKSAADLLTPGVTWPALAIFAANDLVQVPWADADPSVQVQVASLKITMTRDGRARTANLRSAVQMMTGTGEGLISAPIVFDPPLAPGLYDTEIAVVLEDKRGTTIKSVKKTVKFGGLLAPAPLAIPPPVTASTFPIEDPPPPPSPASSIAPSAVSSATAPQPSSSPIAPPPIPPKRSGCGCDTTARPPVSLEMLVALALLALLVARRSQRTRA